MRILFAALVVLGLLSTSALPATYQELADLAGNNSLRGKIERAVTIKAHATDMAIQTNVDAAVNALHP